MDELITFLLGCEEQQIETTDTTPIATAVSPQTEPQSPAPVPATNDIAILQQHYGELNPGMTIVLDIASACEMLNKTRRRKDTFLKLQKELRDGYGVELIIKSRKHG